LAIISQSKFREFLEGNHAKKMLEKEKKTMDKGRLSRYRNAEYLQYMKHVLKTLEKEDLEQLLLVNDVAALQAKVNYINALFKQDLASTLTEDIAALEERRQEAYKGMKALCKAYGHHFDEAYREAAAALLKVLMFYQPGKVKTSYEKFSALLDNLVDDLETDTTLQAAVALLHLENWVAELKSATTDFSEKYLERVDEKVDTPIQNLRVLREENTTLYRALIAKIEAYSITSETPAPYVRLQESINVLIKKYNLLIGTTAVDTDETTDDTVADISVIDGVTDGL